MLMRHELSHGWTFSQSGQHRPVWLEAQVPGHVHLDLVRNGVIADPLTRMHELGCQWVDEADWTYRTSFEWHPEEGLPNTSLVFHGLDTVCTIFLNDTEIARCDNMHVALDVPVRHLLREGTNELKVEFESAARVGRERMKRYFEQEGIAEDAAGFFERSFVRKAQYMFGWDWGPRLVSCGIWKPVEIVDYAGRIVDVHVRQDFREDGSVALVVATEAQGAGAVQHVVLDPDGEGLGLSGPDGEFVIENPILWDGPDCPALYTVVSYLLPSNDAEQELHDVRSTEVGLRQVRLVREPDHFGESFYFTLNGRQLWSRGANWIPDHSFPSCITRERLRERLELFRDMNGNMLRVWGGGLYESDDFYDLADELGILIWQDFAYGCAYYPDDEPAQADARREAEYNIKRLRNHPSLAFWCGNNENQTMWDSAWGGKERRPKRLYGDHLYQGAIPEALARLDPDRDYIPSSPWSDGKQPANDGGIGDQHYWSVWHGGDWRQYQDSTARFCSEFGFIASCSLKTWRTCLAPRDHSPTSDVVRWHDKSGKGYEAYLGLVGLHYPEPKDLEELVYFSQLNQRDALRFGIEHFRCSEFCKGALVWQLNDCWPVQSWAVVDCEGVPKASAYDLARVYDDLVFSIDADRSRVRARLANDGPEDEELTVVLVAWSLLTGKSCLVAQREFSAKAGARGLVFEEPLRDLKPEETLFVLQPFQAGTTWTLGAEPKDLVCTLPEVRASWQGNVLTVASGSLPLVDLWVYDSQGDAVCGPNFVTVLPGAEQTFVFDSKPSFVKARCLQGALTIPQP